MNEAGQAASIALNPRICRTAADRTVKMLVTGGAGFIGSNYVRSLLAGEYPGFEDVHVTVLDRLTYAGNTASLPLDNERLTFVKGDIRDGELLSGLLPGHDTVVHFAAESHVDRSIVSGRQFMLTNVLGTETLLASCVKARVRRVVQVSTDEVYGSIDEGAWTEESALLPNSPYSASKAAADLTARAYHRTHGLDVRITRGSNTYGRYQFPEKMIPLFVTRLLDGEEVPVYGDGRHVREWLHVVDHCAAIQLVLEKGRPGEVYNVGGRTAMSNNDLTAMLVSACDADSRLVRHVQDRPGHDRRYALDWRKIRDELDYRPRITFERGLADTVEWYRQARWWWEPLKRSAEFDWAR